MKHFVTFEGIDGSGKTTVSKGVYERLKKDGYNVVLTFEPTDSFVGKCVKQCVEEKCDPATTALLFIADRVEHCKKIKRWLDQGKTVLCDRYADSTYAYQGAQLEGIIESPVQWLQELSKDFIFTPEKTFLFDINSVDALKRIRDREKLLFFEREEFLKKVRLNYLRLAEEERFVVLDGKKQVDELIEECLCYILE